jgi:DNA-binding response OmpR family regulator
MEATILIVEDDHEFAYLLRENLQDREFQVLLAKDGVDGLQVFQKHHPDLILLDVMMPGMDGWETCRCIREISNVPIIMLTCRQDEADTVHGLQLGADDYVTKPFSMDELLARIQTVLRRAGYPNTPEHIVRVDKRLVIDRMRQQVFVEGRAIALTAIEFRLLTCFLDQPNCILPHQNLLAEIWGWEYAQETNYLKVYIHHLRSKIERDPQNPRYILTERGQGYCFQIPSSPEPVSPQRRGFQRLMK